MPNGLSIGAGIAKGAENFVNSYMQAKAYKDQQKMQKHQIILQSLYRNLEDDNIPYNERAKIFDAIPGLLNIKLDAPLSHKIGLHDLLGKDVETESAKAATPTTSQFGRTSTSAIEAPEVSTPEGVSMGVSDPGNELTTSVSQQGTQAEAAKTVKFGDLSPAKHKQLLINRQQDIETERSLDTYRRKAEIDLDLQDRTLKAQGYTKEIARGIDSNTGLYTILRANQNGDVKSVTMPKGFVPLELMVAQTKSTGSKLPASVRAYQAYFENQINPDTGTNFTSEEAQAKAVEYYKNNGDVMFGLTKAQKDATTTGTNLRNAGEMPLSGSEKAAIEDRRAAAEERKDTILDTQEGVIRDSNNQLVGVKENLSAAEAAHEQAKAARDAWIKSNGTLEGEKGFLSGILGATDHSRDIKFVVDGKTYFVDPSDLTDDEYKALNAEVDKTRQETNKWRAEQGKILGNIRSAETRINSLKTRRANSGSSNTGTVTISNAQIETFRKNNANNDKVRAMKDEDIRQIIMRNRNKWQP